MTNISSNIQTKDSKSSRFDALQSGDFLMAPDLKHLGMKLTDRTIRWFQNRPDEYHSVQGIEHNVSGENVYAVPADVRLEVKL